MGLSPSQPGLKEFILKKPNIPQNHINATIPVRDELLKISWELRIKKELKLTVPKGTMIKLEMNSLVEKGETLVVNNKRSTSVSEYIILKEGEYLIHVNK